METSSAQFGSQAGIVPLFNLLCTRARLSRDLFYFHDSNTSTKSFSFRASTKSAFMIGKYYVVVLLRLSRVLLVLLVESGKMSRLSYARYHIVLSFRSWRLDHAFGFERGIVGRKIANNTNANMMTLEILRHFPASKGYDLCWSHPN